MSFEIQVYKPTTETERLKCAVSLFLQPLSDEYAQAAQSITDRGSNIEMLPEIIKRQARIDSAISIIETSIDALELEAGQKQYGVQSSEPIQE